MGTLIFATNNPHKVSEIRSILGMDYHIITLLEAGIKIDIPEPHATLEQNATEKSSAIYQLTGKDCFSEDTGLEVNALNMEPGVKSARYAGNNSSNIENVQKLLLNMAGKADRSAQFRTIISLLIQGVEYQFEGTCKGTILAYTRGGGGFGYDPIFVPEGSTNTFAEMDIIEKNHFSHRQKAVSKMITFLRSL